MIELAAALEAVEAQCQPLAAAGTVDLHEALDRVLGHKVMSRADVPPAPKAMMDGYAVHSADLTHAGHRLQLCEQVPAGRCPEHPLPRGYTTQLMTGAPLPEGADAVVMRERTSDRPADGYIEFHVEGVTPGMHVAPAGSSIRRGETVYNPGHRLTAIDLGILAELGVARVDVVARPTVAVLATGSELVDVRERWREGHTYNSNGPLLCALLRRWGIHPLDLGIGPDEPERLTRLIRQGLQADILLITGGMSAGDWDLVPGLLKQLGVVELFHGVRIKPGKPVWFGCQREMRGDTDRLMGDGSAGSPPPPSRLVFGLPGNPVSTLVCFHVLVLPALRRVAGEPWTGAAAADAVGHLAVDWTRVSDRPTFWPARLESRKGHIEVSPLAWKGSYDLRTLAQADALMVFDAGTHSMAAGSLIHYLPLTR